MSSSGSLTKGAKPSSSSKLSSLLSKWENNARLSGTAQTTGTGTVGSKRSSSGLITSNVHTTENGSSSVRERKSRLVDQRWGKVLAENSASTSVEKSTSRHSRTGLTQGTADSKGKHESLGEEIADKGSRTERKDSTRYIPRKRNSVNVTEITSKWNNIITNDTHSSSVHSSPTPARASQKFSKSDVDPKKEDGCLLKRPRSFSGIGLDDHGSLQGSSITKEQQEELKRDERVGRGFGRKHNRQLERSESKVLIMAQMWDDKQRVSVSDTSPDFTPGEPSDKTSLRKQSLVSTSSFKTPLGSVSSVSSQSSSRCNTPDPTIFTEKATDAAPEPCKASLDRGEREAAISHTAGDAVNGSLASDVTAHMTYTESSSPVDNSRGDTQSHGISCSVSQSSSHSKLANHAEGSSRSLSDEAAEVTMKKESGVPMKESDTSELENGSVREKTKILILNSDGDDRDASMEESASELREVDVPTLPRGRADTHAHRIQVAPQGRRKPSSNPVKMLQARTDIRSELEPTPVSGKQIFTKSAQLAGYNVSLATAAVAGLAAKEDIKAVKLSSSGDSGIISWPQKLLIHIKGRRSVQVRLVEPVASSVNSGDSYILVDALKRAVYQFIGKSANVVEKAKSSDIAHDLVHGKDCGSKATQVSLVEEGKRSSSNTESAFWRSLGGRSEHIAKSAEEGGDDVAQEKDLMSRVTAYRLSEDETELVVDEELSGKTLRVASLDHKQLFVFDFGVEMYVWTGRRASNDHRRKVPQLAQELYDKGYCPGGDSPLKPRPSWGVFARMKAGGESILFRSKFFDWPEPGKIIKTKTDAPAKKPNASKGSASAAKPCDVLSMLATPDDYPGLILQSRNVGRGRGEAPCEDAVLGGNIVKTETVKKWLVKDNTCIEVADLAYSDFFNEDAYIIRWQYTLHSERDNIRHGRQSMQLGGAHTAFFFWQGQQCRINEKGAVALITIELAGSEGDPQVRVSQGHEPPAFIQLFDGGMTVHSSSSQSVASSDTRFRLYSIYGQQEHEALLVEVPDPSYESLRSRHAFVALDVRRKQVYTWHGDLASSFACKMASAAGARLHARQCADNPWAFFHQESGIETELEGCESPMFVKLLGGHKKLWDAELKLKKPPRLFVMSSTTGQFVATELLPAWHYKAKPADFPAVQSQLYDVPQPALALVEAGKDIFVWAGWLREDSEDERGTGNVRSRLVKDKMLALKTAQAYVKTLDTGSKYTATIVTAGHEPNCFKALFPTWTDRSDVQECTAKIQPCSRLSPIPLDEEMELLFGTTYSWEVLKQRPLPDNLDVDASVLENYLQEEDFEAAFGKTKDDFFSLPTWKKLELKKKAGLF